MELGAFAESEIRRYGRLSEAADRWRYYRTEDLKQLSANIKQLDPWRHPMP